MSFKCPVCGKTFRKLYTLKQHFNQYHDGNTCPLCGSKHRLITGHYRQTNDPKHHLCYFLRVHRFRCNPAIRLEALKILKGG